MLITTWQTENFAKIFQSAIQSVTSPHRIYNTTMFDSDTVDLSDLSSNTMPQISPIISCKIEHIIAEFFRSNRERFEFLEKIGRGGMSQIIKARDLQKNIPVAIKFILLDSARQWECYHQEAQALSRINHKNICRAYEAGVANGQPYLSLQFIAGQSIKDATKEMNLSEKLEIIHQTADAISFIHQQGFIHCDIKPANIMVEREQDRWHPYLIDFGLAREINSLNDQSVSTIMGTPAYMSPEQVVGQLSNLDERTDIYSLGATCYELLSGYQPFTGNYQEIFKRIPREYPLPLDRINANIPASLARVVMKCLAKEPADRYASVREFISALN